MRLSQNLSFTKHLKYIETKGQRFFGKYVLQNNFHRIFSNSINLMNNHKFTGNEKLVELLLKYGAKRYVKNKAGISLHEIAKQTGGQPFKVFNI